VQQQVEGDAGDANKTSFTNFKNVVWHESFHVLLRTIAEHTAEGYWHLGVDGIERLLFPILLILSADYEEQ
jgi:hypothetical protein